MTNNYKFRVNIRNKQILNRMVERIKQNKTRKQDLDLPKAF